MRASQARVSVAPAAATRCGSAAWAGPGLERASAARASKDGSSGRDIGPPDGVGAARERPTIALRRTRGQRGAGPVDLRAAGPPPRIFFSGVYRLCALVERV